MTLRMFKALLPYFGGKRKLCPIIFGHIANYLPREKWAGAVFVDAFLGSGAVSLYAKGQGFQVLANDIAERSFIAGKAIAYLKKHEVRAATDTRKLGKNVSQRFYDGRGNSPSYSILDVQTIRE